MVGNKYIKNFNIAFYLTLDLQLGAEKYENYFDTLIHSADYQ